MAWREIITWHSFVRIYLLINVLISVPVFSSPMVAQMSLEPFWYSLTQFQPLAPVGEQFLPNRRISEDFGESLSLQWRHNGCDGVSNNQLHDCLLNRLFRRRSNETSKLCVTGLCAGNSPIAGEFPAQMTSSAEKVSIWWRHHDLT